MVDIGVFTRSVAYDEEAKRRFHSQGAAVLRDLAKELGYQKGDYDLRHNLGGIAVSGEVTLHSDTLYVQLSQSALGPAWGFMWRRCNGRKDYTGGRNRWMPWDRFLDIPEVAREMENGT